MQNTMTSTKHKTIHREGTESTANIIQTCDEKARQKRLLVPINRATDRAVTHTGISQSQF